MVFLSDQIRTGLGVARRVYRIVIGAFLFKLLKTLCKFLAPKIVLTYSNRIKPDGVGAQLQRIFAIRSLSHNLGLGYHHTGINSVAIHPLDPYQTMAEMQKFVVRLNAEFHMQDSKFNPESTYEVCEISSLNFRTLLVSISKSIRSNDYILIKCVEPYAVAELDSNLYANLLTFLPNYVALTSGDQSIGIHYRRGVGGFSIQAGESVSREISAAYFTSIAQEIIKFANGKKFKIIVFTDTPAIDSAFRPPVDQLELWKNSRRFNAGEMQLIGLDLDEIFHGVSTDVEIVYGGDPLDVLKNLASVQHLVLSRSSFGYVAALLNHNGNIYFPSKFWHIPKKSWKVIREDHYE
jgi:hypothetical protein